jgi:Helix-turn-helix domain
MLKRNRLSRKKKTNQEIYFSEEIMNNPLLTVSDVAKFLQISERTVYDRARELGGFFPVGIRVLRFKPEIIYGDADAPGSLTMVSMRLGILWPVISWTKRKPPLKQ